MDSPLPTPLIEVKKQKPDHPSFDVEGTLIVTVVDRVWLALAALSGGAAVAASAYASHGLAGDAVLQGWMNTGAHLQLVHAAAMLGLTALARRSYGVARLVLRAAGWAFLGGVAAFSGALYIRALGGEPPFAMMAPSGGTALLVGWAMLALSALLPGWGDKARR